MKYANLFTYVYKNLKNGQISYFEFHRNKAFNKERLST